MGVLKLNQLKDEVYQGPSGRLDYLLTMTNKSPSSRHFPPCQHQAEFLRAKV